MSCGSRLTAVDLVPILSYLALMARCRHCGARISPRYALIEAATGLIFVFAVLQGMSVPLTLLTIAFLLILLIIFVYDIEHLIIPDEYVVMLSCAALVLVTTTQSGINASFLWRLLAPLATFAFFGGLWKVSGGRWIGLGDAKLSVPLAFTVGLSSAFSLIVFAFWIGAAVSLTILCVERLCIRGQRHLRFGAVPLTMRTEVPFAPFLVGSFALVYFFHADVYTLTDTLLTYMATH
jgi:prepilin signal peptidase PulO-like enzyme (type II secretory pathway)